MNVREKLVALCEDLETLPCCDTYEGQAEYLLSHGVTVQKCKLGAKKTNADRIRSMSDEELAMCLYEIGYYRGWNALEGTLEWLQQPAEESDKETVEEQKDGDWNG